MTNEGIAKVRLLDPQIREILFDYLEGQNRKIRILEEVNIGGSRADFVTVTDGIMTGYEIKSDADSYKRLTTQTQDYSVFCDYCYAVIGDSHREEIFGRVPEYWGVITVRTKNGGSGLELLRKAGKSPNVEMRNKLWLLWKRELVNIRVKFGLQKYENKNRNYLCRSLEKQVPHEFLARAITDELFERDYNLTK